MRGQWHGGEMTGTMFAMMLTVRHAGHRDARAAPVLHPVPIAVNRGRYESQEREVLKAEDLLLQKPFQ